MTIHNTLKSITLAAAFAIIGINAASADQNNAAYVAAGATKLYTMHVHAGQHATLQLRGYDGVLVLRVNDEYGNLICESDSYSKFEECSWTAEWTGDFSIEVNNPDYDYGTGFDLESI